MCASQAALHRGVEGARVGIVLGAAAVENRREVGAAAEPRLAGDDEARVHVHRRHVRIVRMRDQRNAGRPEARIAFGARDFLAELRREFAVDGRAMHADLLEHAAVHHRHHAAATRLAGVVGALPGRALETARRIGRTAAGQPAARPRRPRRLRRCRCVAARTRRGPGSCGCRASWRRGGAWPSVRRRVCDCSFSPALGPFPAFRAAIP